MKNPKKVAQGKRNRAAGARFERKVREDLESKGWTVDKFTNNINLDNSCFIPAKSNRFMSRSCGFPDFVAFRKDPNCWECENMELKFVECKVNGTLSKIEKLKMEWLRGEGYKVEVAYRERTSVEYKRPSRVFRKATEDKT